MVNMHSHLLCLKLDVVEMTADREGLSNFVWGLRAIVIITSQNFNSNTNSFIPDVLLRSPGKKKHSTAKWNMPMLGLKWINLIRQSTCQINENV